MAILIASRENVEEEVDAAKAEELMQRFNVFILLMVSIY